MTTNLLITNVSMLSRSPADARSVKGSITEQRRIMNTRVLLGTLLLLLLFPLAAAAQADQQWPPLSYLRSDYRASAIVAHVRVTEAEVANRIVGLEDWRGAWEVIETVKSKVPHGGRVYHYYRDA